MMWDKLSIAALLLVVAAASGARADENTVYDRATARDPKNNESWRPNLRGAFRTPFGLQIHASCVARATDKGLSKPEALKGMLKALEHAFDLMSSCEQRYPELGAYIGEWVTQMRRSVLTCTKRTQKELEFGAVNYIFNDDDMGKDAAKDLDVEGVTWQSLPRLYKTVVLLPADTVQDIALFPGGSSPEWGVDSLIHEVLHSTHANNYGAGEHNNSESFGPGEKGACGQDVTTDRINVIATLCSHSNLNPGKNTKPSRETAIELHDRMDACGSGKGCEGMFQQTVPNHAWGALQSWDNYYTQSQGLPQQAAQSLCAKIYDTGACHAKLAVDGRTRTIDNEALKGFGSRIGQRISLMFPRDRVELTNEAIAAFPGLREKVDAARSTDCFKSLFAETRFGVRLNKPYFTPGAASSPGKPGFIGDNIAKAVKYADANGPCAGSKGDAVKAMGTNFDDWMRQAFSSEAYQQMYRARAGGVAERNFELSGHADLAKEWAFGQIIGQNGLKDYLGALKRNHYESPDYDCKANGLSLTANLASALNVSQARSCQ